MPGVPKAKNVLLGLLVLKVPGAVLVVPTGCLCVVCSCACGSLGPRLVVPKALAVAVGSSFLDQAAVVLHWVSARGSGRGRVNS